MYWGFDPLKKITGGLLNKTPLAGPLGAIGGSPVARTILSGPDGLLPASYQTSSPWTNVKMAQDEEAEKANTQRQQAFSALANSEGY
jgi:hypothetical protein